MSTPGDFGPSSGNPYGGPGQQGGPGGPPHSGTPYGAPGDVPPNPYGAPQPGTRGGPGAQQPLDGVSIASFVTSLLCCTGIVGVVLGFVGLARTKGGRRRGRWAAVSGLVIGALGTLAIAGAVIVIIATGAFSTITPDNAEAGQCMNVRNENSTVYLTEKDCTDEHDGEIVWVGEVNEIDEEDPQLVPSDINDLTDSAISQTVCGAMVGEDAAAIDSDLDWGMATEDPSDIDQDDTVICYVESDDKLDEPIL